MSKKLVNNNSAQSIRSEISRFESVHPNIYAIYELLEQLDEVDVSDVVKNTIKNYVVAIEDSFVNSQEWTVPRFINILKLGIVGSINSGKSALVHRFLTGSYVQDESPEGGRFKKEVIIEDISCLLLIRDEGSCPDRQFTLWADAIIVVFSLENEESLIIANDYYHQMSSFRNTADVPLVLVGTQDAISDSNPRLIDDSKARRMASNFGRALYYETCATYGLNVDRVFLDVCSRLLATASRHQPHHNLLRSRPTTPQVINHATTSHHPVLAVALSSQATNTQPKRSISNDTGCNIPRLVNHYPTNQHQSIKDEEPLAPPLPARPENLSAAIRQVDTKTTRATQQADMIAHIPIDYESRLKTLPSPRGNGGSYGQRQDLVDNHVYSEYNMLMGSTSLASTPVVVQQSSVFDFSVHHRAEKSITSIVDGGAKEPTTPGGTPTQSRKNKRKSILFKPHSDKDLIAIDKNRQQIINGIGSGRSIPVKQGYLYKRSNNQINKDRKNRKYVTLVDDARVIYYSTMNDYINQVRGKEIDLQLTSIKIPGVAYRNSCVPGVIGAQIQTLPAQNSPACTRAKDGVTLDQESYEFILIGNDNHQWLFEATSEEDRDDWIVKIESLILLRLQLSPAVTKHGNTDSASTTTAADTSSANVINQCREADRNDNCNNNGSSTMVGKISTMIRSIAGNDICSDCSSPDACWASLNLGTSICIECSGVHRQLGTHISRVRSFQLDDWSKEQLAVMYAIGNTVANSVWEANVHASGLRRPLPGSLRSEKEAWIRAKYEQRQFLPPLPYTEAPVQQQLIDAITRQDTRQVILCLALAGAAVDRCYSEQDPRTALHIAATLGHVVYLQLLLWYNADPTITDIEGHNAFFYAYYSGQLDCADFLLRCGATEERHSRSQSSGQCTGPTMMHHSPQSGTMPPRPRDYRSTRTTSRSNGHQSHRHHGLENGHGHGPVNNNYIDYS